MKTIGKYTVRALLGRGGMGKVFKVEHPIIGTAAALKLLDPDPLLVSLMGNDAIRKMFLAEALTLAELKHPNVVEILDFDEFEGRPFYLMTYHVNSLGALIGEGSRPGEPSRPIHLEKALGYARQTLQGLSCLHHAGIIHRDIKPFNLLITEQDTIKICDFGLSKLHGETFAGPPTLKVGSAWYAPPEQETDPDGVDVTADLYSMGICFYRMLTGVLPTENYRPVAAFNTDLDRSWDDFIRRAISHNRAERYASGVDMLDDLDELSQAWREKKAGYCSAPGLVADAGPKRRTGTTAVRLRRRCIKTDPRSARTRFAVDRLWRPQAYWVNDFSDNSDGTITDATTGLMWQQSGSAFPLDWRKAAVYIETINTGNFSGHADWRLPTVMELMTLLTELPNGSDHCIEPVFDRQQKWLWSCDRRSFTAAWYVSVDLGFIAWQDFGARFYVRAVRTDLIHPADPVQGPDPRRGGSFR